MTGSTNDLGSVDVGAPPLLILTRFGLGVKDRAWLEHRLVLISSITAPSLLAQSDDHFRWALLIDEDLSPDLLDALKVTLAPFGERALVYAGHRFDTTNALAIARDAGVVSDDQLVLTGLIDDDDAWSRGVVGAVRGRCDRWLKDGGMAPGLGISFEYGLEWVMYDMLDVDRLWKGGELEREATIRTYSFPFLGTSVFVLSRLPDQVSAVSAGHSRMGDFLAGRGYDVDVVSTDRPMWLCCRHKQTGSTIQKSRGEDLEMSVAELAVDFGIDEARTAHYLANVDEYGYSVVKRLWRHRHKCEAQLREVRKQLRQPKTEDSEASRLKEREAQLEEDLTRMTDGVVGDFEEASTDPPKYEN
jgi:Putative rhamnosyl transferase